MRAIPRTREQLARLRRTVQSSPLLRDMVSADGSGVGAVDPAGPSDQQHRHGYLLFLNINITSKNVDDVKALTRIAHGHNIGVDYHLNERPHVEQPHYRHLDNDTYITEEHYEQTDALLDWLLDRCLKGQMMINHAAHLRMMKLLMRGSHPPWVCQAGINTCAVRLDGSLSPCFGLNSSNHDWGRVGAPRFHRGHLAALKQRCTRHCLSTCQFSTGRNYSRSMSRTILEWLALLSNLGGRRAMRRI